MSERTGTFNSVALGDYLVPIKYAELDIAETLDVNLSVEGVFESHTARIRNIGPTLFTKVLRFCKDSSVSGSGYDTDTEQNAYYESLSTSFQSLIGSTTGKTLVITDGVKTMTWANVQLKRLDKVGNIQGKCVIEAEFICPSKAVVT